jgi:hypothetical protein
MRSKLADGENLIWTRVIHELRIEDGEGILRELSDAVNQQHIVLAKDDSNKRTILGLRNAERLMFGYYA